MLYQNIWEKEGLYRIFAEKVRGSDILDSNLSIHGDSRFDDINYVINDFTRILEFEVSDLDIDKVATIDKVAAMSKRRLKIAIVATLESLLDWVHLYCERMEDSPYECELFENYNDAYEWVTG